MFEIAPHFKSIFELIFIDFSFDFRPPAKLKTRLKPWRVVRFTLFPFSSCLSFWSRFWTILGSILEWFWAPFSYFFRFQDRSKNQRFFTSVFLRILLDFGTQDGTWPAQDSRKILSQGGSKIILTRLLWFFVCLIFVLGAFWVDFCTILIDSGTLFQQILGSMFDFSAPFRSLLGSLPSSFHAFVLPFLPPAHASICPSVFS